MTILTDPTLGTATSIETADPLDQAQDSRPDDRRRLTGLRRGRGILGLTLVGVVVLLGVLAPVLAPYAPGTQFAGANLTPSSGAHWLGTDEVNRDILSRALYGIRVDLLVVFLAVPVGAVLGSLLGLVSSWWSWSDIVAQRALDLVLAFPPLILGIALTAFLGPGVFTVVVVIVAVELPVFGRLMRTAVRGVRQMPYVEAAQVVGARPSWVLRRHVLPNSLEPVTVQLAVSMSVAVFIEGAMSFLGLGVRPPTPSLGSLIRDGVKVMYDAPWFAIGPLLVVVALVLGLLLIAKSLAEGGRR